MYTIGFLYLLHKRGKNEQTCLEYDMGRSWVENRGAEVEMSRWLERKMWEERPDNSTLSEMILHLIKMMKRSTYCAIITFFRGNMFFVVPAENRMLAEVAVWPLCLGTFFSAIWLKTSTIMFNFLSRFIKYVAKWQMFRIRCCSIALHHWQMVDITLC